MGGWLQTAQPISDLATVFAAWIETWPNPAPDPQGPILTRLHAQHTQPDQLLAALFEETDLLRELAPVRPVFCDEVATALSALRQKGLRAVLRGQARLRGVKRGLRGAKPYPDQPALAPAC